MKTLAVMTLFAVLAGSALFLNIFAGLWAIATFGPLVCVVTYPASFLFSLWATGKAFKLSLGAVGVDADA